jgi:hypothetical protein
MLNFKGYYSNNRKELNKSTLKALPAGMLSCKGISSTMII